MPHAPPVPAAFAGPRSRKGRDHLLRDSPRRSGKWWQVAGVDRMSHTCLETAAEARPGRRRLGGCTRSCARSDAGAAACAGARCSVRTRPSSLRRATRAALKAYRALLAVETQCAGEAPTALPPATVTSAERHGEARSVVMSSSLPASGSRRLSWCLPPFTARNAANAALTSLQIVQCMVGRNLLA